MILRTLLIVGMISLLIGCGDKEMSPKQAIDQVSSPAKASIWTDEKISFSDKYRDGLNFSEPEKLLKEIDKHLASSKENQEDISSLLVLRALVQSQLGAQDAAFDDMTAALQMRPDAELYALRAFILWRGGKMRGAIRDAEYAQLKEDKIALGIMVEGLVFLDENELSKACPKLNEACQAGQCYGIEYAREKGNCN